MSRNKANGIDADESEDREKDGNLLQYLLFGQEYATFDRQLWCLSAIMTTEFGSGFYEITLQKYIALLSRNAQDQLIIPIFDTLVQYLTLIGIVLTFIVMTQWGRRNALLFVNEINFCAFFIISIAPSFYLLSIAIILLRIASVGSSFAHIVYLTEIIGDDLRGFFAAFGTLLYHLGFTVGKVVPNHKYPEYTIVGLWTLWPAVSVMLSNFIPETPVWLLLNGRPRLAKKRHFWVNERTPDTEREYRHLLARMGRIEMRRRRGIISNIFSKAFVKPLIIIFIIFTVRNCLIIVLIFVDTMSTKKLPKGYAFADTMLQTIMTIAVFLNIYRLTRRRMFLASSAGAYLVALIVVVIGVYLDLDRPTYIIYLFALKTCIYGGIVHIPVYLSAEYFPIHLRDLGAAIVHIQFQYFDSLLRLNHVPLTMETSDQLFWLCWITGVICIIILYFIMPNTDGLPLAHIHENLSMGPWIPKTVERQPVILTLSKSDIAPRKIDQVARGMSGRTVDDGKDKRSTTTEKPDIEPESEDEFVEEEHEEQERTSVEIEVVP